MPLRNGAYGVKTYFSRRNLVSSVRLFCVSVAVLICFFRVLVYQCLGYYLLKNNYGDFVFGGSGVSIFLNEKKSQGVVFQSDSSPLSKRAVRIDNFSKQLRREGRGVVGVEIRLAQANQKLELLYEKKKRELERADKAYFDCAEGPERDKALQRVRSIERAVEKLANCLSAGSPDPESRVRQIESILREIPSPSILKAREGQPKAELLDIDALQEGDIFELDTRAMLVPGSEKYDLKVHKNTQANIGDTHPARFEEESRRASHTKNVAFKDKRICSMRDGSESILPLSLTVDALEAEIASCEKAIKQKEKVLQQVSEKHLEIEKEWKELEGNIKEIEGEIEIKNKQFENEKAYYKIIKTVGEEIEGGNELGTVAQFLAQERDKRKKDVSQIRKECEDLEGKRPLQEDVLEEKKNELIRLNDEWKALAGIYSKLEIGQAKRAALAICESELKKTEERARESESVLHRKQGVVQLINQRAEILCDKEAKLHDAFQRLRTNIKSLMKPKLESLRKQRDELLGSSERESESLDRGNALALDERIGIYKERLTDAKEIYSHRKEVLEDLKKQDAGIAEEIENSEWYLNQIELGALPEQLQNEEGIFRTVDEARERHRELQMSKQQSEAKIEWLSSLVEMQRGAVWRAQQKVEALDRQVQRL